MPVPRICWVAHGLAADLTGIERFAIGLLDGLLEAGVALGDDLVVLTARRTSWTSAFEARGARVLVVPGGRLIAPRYAGRFAVVHNLGGGLFPVGATASTRIYGVYDWGPFRDPEMTVKARAAWMAVAVRGWRTSTHVHLLNADLERQRPSVVRRWHRQLVVAGPRSSLVGSAGKPRLRVPLGAAVYIGTVSPRKRVDDLVRLARATGRPLVLVGGGTERYHSPPEVVALGRVSDEVVADLLEQADFLALLSRYEGFGIPILEAAAHGIHSVVSAEVFATLPIPLQAFAHVSGIDDPATFARAAAAATSARGTLQFQGPTLLEPLLETYRVALAGQ